jgi:exportin-1
MDSIVWAFKHTMRDIADMGLNSELCSSALSNELTRAVAFEMANNFANSPPEVANSFYQQYLLGMIGDVFYVLTDADHKSGFRSQALLLARLISLVESGTVSAPLFDPSQVQDPSMTNAVYLRGYLSDLLAKAFGNMQPAQIQHFVNLLFEASNDLTRFKSTLRDFLISLKEFTGDNADLYIEEKEAEIDRVKQEEMEKGMRVPGMIKPSLMDDADDQD